MSLLDDFLRAVALGDEFVLPPRGKRISQDEDDFHGPDDVDKYLKRRGVNFLTGDIYRDYGVFLGQTSKGWTVGIKHPAWMMGMEVYIREEVFSTLEELKKVWILD